MMSHRFYLLFLLCFVSQSPAYGQRIQEVHVESVLPEADELDVPKLILDLAHVQQQIFKKTNEFRTEEHRVSLQRNSVLDKAAKAFAEYLAETDKFSHTADGKEPWDRTTKAGYEHAIILENIAYEFSTADFTPETLAKEFESGWEKSPGHRKNLLDADVQDIGIGVVRSSRSGRYYAVQNFGRPKSAMITFKVSNRIDEPVKITIDGKVATVEPRYTFKYERSRPPVLCFSLPEEAKVTPAAQMEFHPANGASYIIRRTNEGAIDVESQ